MVSKEREIRPNGGLVPVAVALVFTLSVGGGFGVAIGASIDDFRRGLVYGGAIGAVVGGLIYAFALRDR